MIFSDECTVASIAKHIASAISGLVHQQTAKGTFVENVHKGCPLTKVQHTKVIRICSWQMPNVTDLSLYSGQENLVPEGQSEAQSCSSYLMLHQKSAALLKMKEDLGKEQRRHRMGGVGKITVSLNYSTIPVRWVEATKVRKGAK